ncbi:MAG: beta-phosphoglucomutase [Leeuwenhoekiella sp.]
MKKGIIFDLDGVIVDTAGLHYLAWKDLANALGFDFTKEQNEQFKGVSRVRCLEILLEIGDIDASQEQIDKWLVSKNEQYLTYISGMTETDILPGVNKVLDYCDANDVPMVVGSASKNAKPILKKVNLLHRFKGVVDGNAVTKAKPDPEVFIIAAEFLGLPPKDCVVFEDAIAGIEAAQNANMASVGIGEKNVLTEADYVFRDLTEISTSFLDNLLKN